MKLDCIINIDIKYFSRLILLNICRLTGPGQLSTAATTASTWPAWPRPQSRGCWRNTSRPSASATSTSGPPGRTRGRRASSSGCPPGNRWASRTGTRGNQIITSKPGLVSRQFPMFDLGFVGTREGRESTVWSSGIGTERWD